MNLLLIGKLEIFFKSQLLDALNFKRILIKKVAKRRGIKKRYMQLFSDFK